MLSRYDAVLSALDAGVVIHAADTQILDANDRARQLLGIRDLEGRLATDGEWVFLESDRSPMTLERFPVMQVIASGERLSGLTMIIVPPDGPEAWLEVSAVPLVDDAGRLEQVAVTFIDITQRRLAEERLAQEEEEARLAFDLSGVATCLVANDGRLIRVNPAMCELLGRTEAQLLAMNFLEVTHPDDVSVGAEKLAELLAGRLPSLRLTKRYVTGSGRVIWGDVTVSAVLAHDGTVRHRIAQILDVTAEHDLGSSLLEAERIAHLGRWQMDGATGHVEWSPELFALFGLDPGSPVPDFAEQERLFTPDSWRRLQEAVAHTQETGESYSVEMEVIRTDGSHWWAEARGEASRDANGAIVGFHGTTLDITDRKLDRDALEQLATHDPLTGLANRVELLGEVSRAVSAGQRSARSTAVLMMDLDRFKAVNDTLGHAVGDELLVAAAARLAEVMRGGDLVSRLGGDEFVIVMRDLSDPAEAVHAGERIVQAFREPLVVAGRELFATASVGVAVTDGEADAGDLLREADTAMYAAKEAGRDRVSTYNEDLRTAVTTRMSVEADLRNALARGQLAVWFQPEVALATGRVVAMEALLRWCHPDGTVWAADRFVSVAEDTGLILDIGDWVMREACTRAAQWAQYRPDRPATVRVNVSAVQLSETGLIEAIDDALSASGLDPRLLCVEITETTLLRRTSVAASNLAAMHERGVSLAIDDFGTGFASLTYIHQYPVDVIKIDRSFVTDAEHDDGLVAGIIALARTLNVAVTAEGVEHTDQARHLRNLGCPSAQGWLYSPAVPADDVPRLLGTVYPHP